MAFFVSIFLALLPFANSGFGMHLPPDSGVAATAPVSAYGVPHPKGGRHVMDTDTGGPS
ncbi:MAG TPA: hypothetical protein VJP85_08910 [Candidatus Baltobacteraceae bacterium]|nr:hypothetical protein [Candidatus Baltobacteraceae bacterium]